MNLSRAVKTTFGVVAAGAALATSVATTASLTACGETGDCARLRNDTYAQKLVWGACDPAVDNQCIKVPGNPRDCTGVLSCDFAVTRPYREQAEQVVLTIAQQSQGCFLCATPSCLAGDIAWCEPVSRQCLLITALVDGGPVFGGDLDSASPAIDTGAPVIDTGATPADSSQE
jgi:hypothetical protein